MNVRDEIKSLVLDMLGNSFQPADIQAVQQMGVNMSNTVKRDGVVIIQNQNVEVYARIIPSLIKVLKALDRFDDYPPPLVVLPAAQMIPEPVAPENDEDDDPIDECCKFMFENGIQWDGMQTMMKARYLEYVVGRFKTKSLAAKMLGINSTYLSKMSQPPRDKGAER